MARLEDLCINVPQELSRKAVLYELARRKSASYRERMSALRAEKNVFDKCQQRRPQKRKVQNRASREEAGTIGRITMGVRTGKYSVCVCSVQNKW